ncbi:hypothetical protein OG809_28195 [Kribbella soli]
MSGDTDWPDFDDSRRGQANRICGAAEPEAPAIRVHGLDGSQYTDFSLPVGSYRARYSATGMDEGKAVDVVPEDEPVVDRYLLQFWPAEAAPDAVIKQTSAVATRWHEEWR